MRKPTLERQTMDKGITKLKPFLYPYGFSLGSSENGSSSGGRFATATFNRDNLEIGLIVRFGTELGCPNYSEGKGCVSHGGLILAIDPNAKIKLVPNGPISYCASDGGDPFDALIYDLERTILPILKQNPAAFSAALAKASGR